MRSLDADGVVRQVAELAIELVVARHSSMAATRVIQTSPTRSCGPRRRAGRSDRQRRRRRAAAYRRLRAPSRRPGDREVPTQMRLSHARCSLSRVAQSSSATRSPSRLLVCMDRGGRSPGHRGCCCQADAKVSRRVRRPVDRRWPARTDTGDCLGAVAQPARSS